MVSSTYWGVTGVCDMTKSPPRGVLEYCQEKGGMMEEKGSKFESVYKRKKPVKMAAKVWHYMKIIACTYPCSV